MPETTIMWIVFAVLFGVMLVVGGGLGHVRQKPARTGAGNHLRKEKSS